MKKFYNLVARSLSSVIKTDGKSLYLCDNTNDLFSI